MKGRDTEGRVENKRDGKQRKANLVFFPSKLQPPTLFPSTLTPLLDLDNDVESVLKLLQKYADVPMSLADACLVRMTETFSDPVILTTDSDFRIYRRHSRQVIPCVMPS